MQKGQDAAGIIVIDDRQRVLLVHQTYGKKQWSLPGGMVEDGESAWDAAKRELKEEVNVAVHDMELSGLYFQPHKNRYIYSFKANGYQGELQVDNKEIDRYGFFELHQLPKPISSFTVQRITDALTNTKSVFKEERLDHYEIFI